MRITRKRYDRAKEVVAKARQHIALIKQWDEAVKQIEKPNSVDAITVNDDGSVRFEVTHKAVVTTQKSEED